MKNKFLFLPTLKINLLRAFFAGIVFVIFGIIIGIPKQPFYIYLLIPVFNIINILMWWLISYPLDLFKLGGIARFIMILHAFPGDPILFIIFKIKPEWNPIDKFNFINFSGIIFVYAGEPNISFQDTSKQKDDSSTKNESCPYKGKISIHKDVNWGGFNWSTSETPFEINDDWKVYHKGSRFGWIDRNGNIHKNETIGDVNLDATLSDTVVANISGSGFYIGNDKVGELLNY